GLTPVIVDEERNATSVDAFLAAWRQMAPDDRLPEGIELRDERGTIALIIQPVYWAQVGGPMPYHDSYTYEIYSYDDVSVRVLDFLRAEGGEACWDFGPVLNPGETGER
ncbi:MAG TPA: hypothetical protein VG387_06905, partial [Rhizomicrobium sp.]|nr:hypothetical protein [Rhizomicrobium sp.]